MALEVVKNLYAVEPHRWGDSLLKPQRWCNRNWSHITTSLDPNSHPLYQIVVKIIHVVLLIVPTIASYSLSLIGILIKSVTPKSDLIAEQVKRTLDDLLGDPGSVDKLPTYIDKISDENPFCIDKMTASIMKGTTDKNIPFIVIKMRCLSSKEEIMENLGSNNRMLDLPDFSKLIEHVLFLYQYQNDLPLIWDQFQDDSEYVYPNFFSENFTVPEDGTVAESQQQNFSNMQEIIQKGSGEDINGIRWEIIP